jgi:ribosomal protein S18 acetylase RimI-like enzyme
MIDVEKAECRDIDAIDDMYGRSIDLLLENGIHQWMRGVYPTRATAEEAAARGFLYRCLCDGTLAAAFIMNESQPPQYGGVAWKYAGRALVLHTLVVDPRFRRRGAGARAVEYVLDRARRGAFGCVRLDVFPGNPAAVSLYRRFGFERAGKVFFGIKEPSYEWYDCYEKKIDVETS